MRICGIIVLYNPVNVVLDHIQTYLDNIDYLFIVDNSEITNPAIEIAVKNRFSNNKLRVIHNNENMGVAAALNQGFQLAGQEGFDWVLTMDQDSYFNRPDFFTLSAPLLAMENMGIIAASYQSKFPFRQNFSGDFYKLLFVVTSGNLVNIRAWKKVGGFDEKLFIDEVDNDFCIRLALHQYIVIGSKDILLNHSPGESFSIKPFFLKKAIPLGIHSPLRINYTIRNRLFILRKYLFRFPGFSFNRIFHSMLLLTFIIFVYPQKRKYMRAFCKGISDSLYSQYGKIG